MSWLAAYWDRLDDSFTFWAAFGFAGQALFASRFLVQWIHSERVGRSEIPFIFWLFSLGGGTILLIYAIHIANAVFIVGQGMGLFVYARNVHLVLRERRRLAASGH
jgi:lipid-A-disaccharide synthase-like uncharacterized protein